MRSDVARGGDRRRLEVLWACLSFMALVICWDRAARLDEHASPPRVRFTHALEEEEGKLRAARDSGAEHGSG